MGSATETMVMVTAENPMPTYKYKESKNATLFARAYPMSGLQVRVNTSPILKANVFVTAVMRDAEWASPMLKANERSPFHNCAPRFTTAITKNFPSPGKIALKLIVLSRVSTAKANFNATIN